MKDGGPAFPIGDVHPNNADLVVKGMSLRDYFAAAALQGMCAGMPHSAIQDRAHGTLGGAVHSKAAYVLADAMLAEREKP